MGFLERRLSQVTKDGTTSSLEQNQGAVRKLYNVRPTSNVDAEQSLIVAVILELEAWWSKTAAAARSAQNRLTPLSAEDVCDFFAAVEGDECSEGGGDATVSTPPHHQIDYSLVFRSSSPLSVPLLTTPPPIFTTTTTPTSLITPPGVATTLTTAFSFSGGSLESFGPTPCLPNLVPQVQAPPPEVNDPAPVYAQLQVPVQATSGRRQHRRQLLGPTLIGPRQNICVLPETADGLPAIYISVEVWAKALMAISYGDDGRVNLKSLIGASKIIFNSLFTDEEVKSCTVSGREGRPILDPRRCRAIRVAVAWMKMNKVNGVDPYAFTPTDPDQHLTPEENDKIHKKVFVERRNDRNREKPLKAIRRRAVSSSNVEFPSTSRQIRRRNATVAGSFPVPIVDEIQDIIDILGVAKLANPADDENLARASKRHKRGGHK